MDVTLVTAGYQFPETRFVLDADEVRAYRDAVGDTSPLYERCPSLVPPMAVAALALRHMLSVLELPPGAVHAGQELTFQRPVELGQELVCRAQVSQAAQRRQWRTVMVEFQMEICPPQTSTKSAMPSLEPSAGIVGRTSLFINLEGSE